MVATGRQHSATSPAVAWLHVHEAHSFSLLSEKKTRELPQKAARCAALPMEAHFALGLSLQHVATS